MLKHIDVRLVPPVLISLILLAGHFSFGILRGFDAIMLAIGTAVAVELLAGRLSYGSWPHPASAYTSGISVGILVRSPMLWPFALCSAVSILSKYVLRVKGQHLWNPSNFGLCVLFFPAAYGLLDMAPLNTQWGNNMWPMLVIWVVGLYTIWKVKRFHITATYIVAFVAFAALRTAITGDSFWAEVALLLLLLGGVCMHHSDTILAWLGLPNVPVDSGHLWIGVPIALGLLGIPGVAIFGLHQISRLLDRQMPDFVTVVYAYLPLTLAANLTHYITAAMTDAGRILPVTARTFGFSEAGLPTLTWSMDVATFLQGVTLLSVLAFSVYPLLRITRRPLWSNLPHLVGIFGLTAFFWVLMV